LKDLFQATRLMNLKSFSKVPVNVSEHSSLNSTQGEVYSNELRGIQEDGSFYPKRIQSRKKS